MTLSSRDKKTRYYRRQLQHVELEKCFEGSLKAIRRMETETLLSLLKRGTNNKAESELRRDTRRSKTLFFHFFPSFPCSFFPTSFSTRSTRNFVLLTRCYEFCFLLARGKQKPSRRDNYFDHPSRISKRVKSK